MGRLKKLFYKNIKASSLTEVIVATTILMLVFAIAIVTLNNILVSSVQKDTSKQQTQIEQLIYQYKNKQLKIPTSYNQGDFIISIENLEHQEVEFVEFSIKNSKTNKTISKRILKINHPLEGFNHTKKSTLYKVITRY